MGCTSSEAQLPALPVTYILGTNSKEISLTLTIDSERINQVNTKFPIPRYCNALLANPKQAYLTGGIQQLQEYLEQGKKFDPAEKKKLFEGTVLKSFYKVNVELLKTGTTETFSKLPEMLNARYAHSSVIYNNKLYVLGGRQYGQDDTALLAACERFNFETRQWEMVPPLRKRRSSALAVVYKQVIYVFGGYTGNSKRSRLIETYKDGDEGWKDLDVRLHRGIEGALLLPSNPNCVLIFGGKTNKGICDSVVQLNLATLSVRSKCKMAAKRCFAKCFQTPGDIYLIGGGSETIEVYNSQLGKTAIIEEPSYLEYCTPKQLNSFAQLHQTTRVRSVLPQKKRIKQQGLAQTVYIFGHSGEPFMMSLDLAAKKAFLSQQSLADSFYQFRSSLKVNDQYVLIMGGINSDYTKVTNRVTSFHLPSETCKQVEKMINPRYAFPSIVKGSYVYVLGGRRLGADDVAIMNQCERFSFQKEKWESINPMHIRRHSSMALLITGYIVVIGGYKGNQLFSNDIELYSDTYNKWTELQQKFQLNAEGMAHTYYKKEIYIFGGRNSEGDMGRVFKLGVDLKGNSGDRLDRLFKLHLDPVGAMSTPGASLKLATGPNSPLVWIFGNREGKVELYDLEKQKTIDSGDVFSKQLSSLRDPLLKSYTIST